MQIHELTQPRRPVNENVLGALAQIAKGTAGQLASQATGGAIGGSAGRFAGQQVTKGLRPEVAWKMSRQNFEKMIVPAAQAWQQNLQQMIAQSDPPVTSSAQLEPQKIKTVLDGMIDQMLQSSDYQKALDQFESMTTVEGPAEFLELYGGSTIAAAAKIIKDNIARESESLVAMAARPPNDAAAQYKDAWGKLIHGGIAPLQHLITFYSNAGPQAAATAAAAPTSKLSPAAQQLLTKMGIDTDGLAAIRDAAMGQTLQRTGLAALDEILGYAKVKLK